MHIGLMLILVVVMAFGVAAVLLRKSRGGRWIAGVVVVVVVALWAFASFFLGHRVLSPRAVFEPAARRASHQQMRQVRTEGASGARVRLGMDEAGDFLADVYPSAASAAEGLARHLASQWKDHEPKDEPPKDKPPKDKPLSSLTIYGGVGSQALQRAADAVRSARAFETVRVSGSAEPRAVGPHEKQAATLGISKLHERGGSPRGDTRLSGSPDRSGSVEARLRAGAFEASRAARYTDKPWVDRTAEYLSLRPDKNYLVVSSDRPCTSHHEARQQAMEIASARLAELVTNSAGTTVWWRGRRDADVPASEVRQRILTILHRNPQFVADQFAQRFQRPYGEIWRHWLLIDASLNNTGYLEKKVLPRRIGWLVRGLSLIGVVGVVLLVYLVLNVATRGYYEWSLRLIAGVLVAAGIIVLLLTA